jgi:catechol 2,3-dioxygenase-like lactoylglutathione lyase family enzyme
MTAAASGEFTAKTHISLTVRDLERSVTFYETFFGTSTHKRRPGYANFDLAVPPLKLALQQGEAKPGGGSLNHLGVQLATRAQVMEARDRLKEAGLATFDEGDTVCCYARQDKLWATDPDGNQWELYVLLDDMLEEEHDHPASAVGAAEPVCCVTASVCCG